MPYATNGGVSRADMSGDPAWIEIDEDQYAQALAGMVSGRAVSIDGGFSLVDPQAPEAPPEPAPVDPNVPPQTVTAAQGGIALIQAGLMNAVQAVVDAPETPPEVRWAWAHATTWDRSSPALAYLANAAGITQEQMDALFIAAAGIVA